MVIKLHSFGILLKLCNVRPMKLYFFQFFSALLYYQLAPPPSKSPFKKKLFTNTLYTMHSPCADVPTYTTYFTSRVPSTDICICCLFSGRQPLILMAFFQKMMLEFFRAIILDDALKRNGGRGFIDVLKHCAKNVVFTP